MIGLAILCCFTHVRTVQSNESGLNQMLMVVAYARKKCIINFFYAVLLNSAENLQLLSYSSVGKQFKPIH